MKWQSSERIGKGSLRAKRTAVSEVESEDDVGPFLNVNTFLKSVSTLKSRVTYDFNTHRVTYDLDTETDNAQNY